jgi:hypothetical protein
VAGVKKRFDQVRFHRPYISGRESGISNPIIPMCMPLFPAWPDQTRLILGTALLIGLGDRGDCLAECGFHSISEFLKAEFILFECK